MEKSNEKIKDVKERLSTLEKERVTETLCSARRETIRSCVDAAIDNFKLEVKNLKQSIYITGAAITTVVIIADFFIRWGLGR